MNRQQRRNQKPNGKSLWDRLSEEEKDVLSKFMIKESNKELAKSIEQTWMDLEKYLFQSMRNNKISIERAEKIIKDTNNMSDRVHNVRVVDSDLMDKYIVLEKEEFSDLIEYAAVACENCAGIENCKLYNIQHEQKVPILDGSFKCKFAYILNRRKVV